VKVLSLVCLFLSPVAYVVDICPSAEQRGYHPMPEETFTTANALANVKSLQGYFEGKQKLDPEFILSAQIIIEGAFLRNEVELANGKTEYLPDAIKQFCNFMATKAYYVH